MTTEDRIDKIEQRIVNLEEKAVKIEKIQMQDKFDLSNLIKDAVSEAVKPLIERLEEQEKRIITLENADARKALESKNEIYKSIRSIIISVVVTFFATILLNNLISIASDNTNIKESEVHINEKDF